MLLFYEPWMLSASFKWREDNIFEHISWNFCAYFFTFQVIGWNNIEAIRIAIVSQVVDSFSQYNNREAYTQVKIYHYEFRREKKTSNTIQLYGSQIPFFRFSFCTSQLSFWFLKRKIESVGETEWGSEFGDIHKQGDE